MNILNAASYSADKDLLAIRQYLLRDSSISLDNVLRAIEKLVDLNASSDLISDTIMRSPSVNNFTDEMKKSIYFFTLAVSESEDNYEGLASKIYQGFRLLKDSVNDIEDIESYDSFALDQNNAHNTTSVNIAVDPYVDQSEGAELIESKSGIPTTNITDLSESETNSTAEIATVDQSPDSDMETVAPSSNQIGESSQSSSSSPSPVSNQTSASGNLPEDIVNALKDFEERQKEDAKQYHDYIYQIIANGKSDLVEITFTAFKGHFNDLRSEFNAYDVKSDLKAPLKALLFLATSSINNAEKIDIEAFDVNDLQCIAGPKFKKADSDQNAYNKWVLKNTNDFLELQSESIPTKDSEETFKCAQSRWSTEINEEYLEWLKDQEFSGGVAMTEIAASLAALYHENYMLKKGRWLDSDEKGGWLDSNVTEHADSY